MNVLNVGFNHDCWLMIYFILDKSISTDIFVEPQILKRLCTKLLYGLKLNFIFQTGKQANNYYIKPGAWRRGKLLLSLTFPGFNFTEKQFQNNNSFSTESDLQCLSTITFTNFIWLKGFGSVIQRSA